MQESMNPPSFEKSFERLEQILELMNGGKVSLEDSLRLFEEAEKLMRHCQTTLQGAEQKIEQLIKGRTGEPLLDSEGVPQKERFL